MSNATAMSLPPWRYWCKYYFSTLLLSLASLFHLFVCVLCMVFLSCCIGGNLLYLRVKGKDQLEVLKVDVQSSSNPYAAFLSSHIPPFFLPVVPKGMPAWLGATTAVSWLWKGKGLGRGGERFRLVREGVEVELEILWSDEEAPPSVLIFPPLLRPVPSVLALLVETIRRKGGGYETIGIVKMNDAWVHEGDVSTASSEDVVRGGSVEERNEGRKVTDTATNPTSLPPSPPMSCIAYSTSGTLLMNYLQKFPTRPLFHSCVCICPPHDLLSYYTSLLSSCCSSPLAFLHLNCTLLELKRLLLKLHYAALAAGRPAPVVPWLLARSSVTWRVREVAAALLLSSPSPAARDGALDIDGHLRSASPSFGDMGRVGVPLLLLHSDDDPLVGRGTVNERFENPFVVVGTVDRGGHCAWAADLKGRSWGCDAAVGFLRAARRGDGEEEERGWKRS
ncbi:hypothetical protein TrRE_jg6144, partial [Triparma retinervis]